MGLWPKLYYRTRSVIEPIRFIPPLAWIPIAIVFMVGFQRYVFLIWLGAFFPILSPPCSALPVLTPFM